MVNDHPDDEVLAFGIEYDQFASDCAKLDENPPSDLGEFARKEERTSDEGLRLLREARRYTAQTIEGVNNHLSMIDHCNQLAGTTSARCAQEGEAVADVLAWQLVAALPAIIERLGITVSSRHKAGAEAV